MHKLIVLKQHKPSRCEICHKADLFDSINNNCQRCMGLAGLLVLDKVEIEEDFGLETNTQDRRANLRNLLLGVMAYCSLSIVTVYLLWANPFFHTHFEDNLRKLYQAICMVAIPVFGFLCFSKNENSKRQGWIGLVSLCFILVIIFLLSKI